MAVGNFASSDSSTLARHLAMNRVAENRLLGRCPKTIRKLDEFVKAQ
jgi:hypothetical protein